MLSNDYTSTALPEDRSHNIWPTVHFMFWEMAAETAQHPTTRTASGSTMVIRGTLRDLYIPILPEMASDPTLRMHRWQKCNKGVQMCRMRPSLGPGNTNPQQTGIQMLNSIAKTLSRAQ